MTLTREARESTLNMETENLTVENGIKKLIKELDETHLKDESVEEYEA